MYKQVIVVRKDLKLDKGKLASQVAHASVGAYKKSLPQIRQGWEDEGEKKVVVKVEDLKELIRIFNEAKKSKLPCVLIKDAGRTHIPPGTVTAVGIGPADEKDIDKITGKLKIL